MRKLNHILTFGLSLICILAFTFDVNAQIGLESDTGIKVGTTTTTDAGTIRYDGTDFQGHDGSSWKSFTTGAGSSPWTTMGSDIYYNLGNVGIGITTPTSPLHVGGSTEIQFNSNSSTPHLRIVENDVSTGGTTRIRFEKSNNATDRFELRSYLDPAVDHRLGWSYNNAFRVVWNETLDGLGIGTDIPTAKLHVNSNSSTSHPHIRITETADNGFGRLFFDNSANGTDKWALSANTGTTADHSFGFYYNGSPRITYNETTGGFGIGTSTPTELLHVDGGDVLFSGALPRLFLISDGAADTRIGFGDNAGGAGDAAIFYDSSEDVLNIGTNTTTGDIHINGSGKVGINENSGLTAQLTIKANAGNITTPATLELQENNNSGYSVLKYSNFSVNGHFTTEANGQYGNFIGGDADYQIRFSEDGTTFKNIMTAMYAYDDQDGAAVNAKDERIGVRTTAPNADLHLVHKSGVSGHGLKIENEDANNHWWKFYVADGNGTLSLRNDNSPAANVGTFAQDGVYTGSDLRLKKDIQSMSYGLTEVMQMETKSYRYISDKTSNKLSLGFIAQEVKEIIPEMVIYDQESDQYSLNYSTTGVLAIKAIQEQQAQIETLKEMVNLLQSQIQELKSEK
jgi:hypothetical protein